MQLRRCENAPTDLCASVQNGEEVAPRLRNGKPRLYLYLLTQVKAARGLWEPFVSKIVV